jgi:hypothetical protein
MVPCLRKRAHEGREQAQRQRNAECDEMRVQVFSRDIAQVKAGISQMLSNDCYEKHVEANRQAPKKPKWGSWRSTWLRDVR